MTRSRARSPFFAGVGSGLAPMLLWAAHFAVCYAGTAIGCTALLQHASIAPASLRTLLLLATAVALAGAAGLVVRAARSVARDSGDLLPRLRLTTAVLALVAVAWTGLPLALLPVCEAG